MSTAGRPLPFSSPNLPTSDSPFIPPFTPADIRSYNSLDIGLFGLLGIIGVLLAPQWGRLVDRVVPWLGQLLGLCTSLTSMIIALAAAQVNIGAICVSIVLYDMGQQLCQVSSSYRIAGIDPKARARLNGCYLLCVFAGQVSVPLPR